MLLSVVTLIHTHQQEEEMRRVAWCHPLHPVTEVTLSRTAFRHPEGAWPREGRAAEFSHRRMKVPWWSNCHEPQPWHTAVGGARTSL